MIEHTDCDVQGEGVHDVIYMYMNSEIVFHNLIVNAGQLYMCWLFKFLEFVSQNIIRNLRHDI